MTEEIVHGLACPQCGGMVSIPEGQLIVRCPYCDLRSFVRGERGLRRYQVPCQIDRAQVLQALQRFLKGHRAIAGETSRKAVLQEVFIAHLPFWTSWSRVMAWIFGQKRVRRGDSTHYEPREKRTIEEMVWNGAACDVGEFGVETVYLVGKPLDVFDPEALHSSGMVFEPVSSLSDARQAAEQDFTGRVKNSANLERISQVFIRQARRKMGLVYYPLWVTRYLYRGRAFQVVVDGFTGEVLYGKAPGSTLYRAAVLVGGMMLGAFLAVDVSALALYLASQMEGDSAGTFFVGGLVVFVIGLGLMWAAYRAFRYGEHYEYRQGERSLGQLNQYIKGLTSWTDQLF